MTENSTADFSIAETAYFPANAVAAAVASVHAIIEIFLCKH